MPEIVDKGELRRQLARSEGERLEALAVITSLEEKLRQRTAAWEATAGRLAQIERQLASLTALQTVQMVLSICHAAHAVRQLTQGSWMMQLWRRLRGRPALLALNETVDKVSP